ncbi:DgyrCDS9164 [Dimorphilus gyrociliatus]|uniref:DgyrCDS9164 n=1 Tax=Dimorphilus gyrociliatus TaxID=2664684 RepID=A0A7I8VY00_9ANNE|nr:DgyrCDS9164 [Dimorphilus gyrociliatus]
MAISLIYFNYFNEDATFADGYSSQNDDTSGSVISKDILLSYATDMPLTFFGLNNSTSNRFNKTSSDTENIDANAQGLNTITSFTDSNDSLDVVPLFDVGTSQNVEHINSSITGIDSSLDETVSNESCIDWCFNGVTSILGSDNLQDEFDLGSTPRNIEQDNFGIDDNVLQTPWEESTTESFNFSTKDVNENILDGEVPSYPNMSHNTTSTHIHLLTHEKMDSSNDINYHNETTQHRKETIARDVTLDDFMNEHLNDIVVGSPLKFNINQMAPSLGLKIIRKLDFIIKENGLVIDNYFPRKSMARVKTEPKSLTSIKQITINEESNERQVGNRRKKPLVNCKLTKTIQNDGLTEVTEKQIFKWPECSRQNKKHDSSKKILKGNDKRYWKNGFMLFASKYRKPYSIAMRSGALPKTKNVMSALSRLWTSMPSSKKIEYNAVARRENEITPEKLYHVVESISPLKSPVYEGLKIPNAKLIDAESEQIVPQMGLAEEDDKYQTSKFPAKNTLQGYDKLEDSDNLELSDEIVGRISNILENSVDGADFLEMLDTTPKKVEYIPEDVQSKFKSKDNYKRKQARKCLNFDDLIVSRPNAITLPRDEFLESYIPPEDHIIPDSYDYDEGVERWNCDEICNVNEELLDSTKRPKLSIKSGFEVTTTGFPNQPVRVVKTPNVVVKKSNPLKRPLSSANEEIDAFEQVKKFKTSEEEANEIQWKLLETQEITTDTENDSGKKIETSNAENMNPKIKIGLEIEGDGIIPLLQVTNYSNADRQSTLDGSWLKQ